MTVVTKPLDTTRTAAATRRGRGWQRILLHVVILGLIVLWVVPTLGLLVNSFRPASDVARSGWWNALFPPWDFTLDNYSRVIAANDLGDAFINSLFITIPATVIPVMVAAFVRSNARTKSSGCESRANFTSNSPWGGMIIECGRVQATWPSKTIFHWPTFISRSRGLYSSTHESGEPGRGLRVNSEMRGAFAGGAAGGAASSGPELNTVSMRR